MRIWRDWFVKGGIMWIDEEENVGLKVHVKEMIVGTDAVYTMEFEELVVRSTHLLLQVEASIAKENSHMGMFCSIDGEYVEEIFADGVHPENIGELRISALQTFA